MDLKNNGRDLQASAAFCKALQKVLTMSSNVLYRLQPEAPGVQGV